MHGCSYCAKLKQLLKDSGVAFRDIDIELHSERYAAAAEASGLLSVPIFYVGDTCVGGSDDAAKLHATGELLRLVRGAPPPTRAFLQPLTDDELAEAQHRGDAKTASATNSALVDRTFTLPVGSDGTAHGDITFSAFVAKARDGKDGVDVRDRGLFWCKKKTFVAHELVTWTQRHLAPTALRPAIVSFLEQLHKRGMFSAYASDVKTFTDSNDLFRFAADGAQHSLNSHRPFDAGDSKEALRSGVDVAIGLRRRLTALVTDFTTPEGVDYEAMGASEAFRDFADATTELQRADLGAMTREGRIAFGINVYNTCIVHAYAVRGPPNGWLDMYRFFNSCGYDLGGHHYTLNDIENGFLRGNRTALGAWSPPFAKGDPRLATVVERPDYRIHCGLNCGAKSCPPVKLFTEGELEAQLKLAADAFLQANSSFDAAHKKLTTSAIVSWYRVDFGADDAAVVETLLTHLNAETVAAVKAVGVQHVKLVYSEYDWSTNAKPRSSK